MLIGFEKADFSALCDLWNRFYPPKYAIDEAVLRYNTTECPLHDWGASIVHLTEGKPDAFLAVKKSASSLFKGPDPDSAFISALAFENASSAIDLFAYAKQILRNRGVYKLVFGQDWQHFFPGCPMDAPGLVNLLTIEGFEMGALQWDVEMDLADYSCGAEKVAVLGKWPGSVIDDPDKPAVEFASEKWIPELSRFLAAEFPGRWEYVSKSLFEREEDLSQIAVLHQSGRVEGFAVTQSTASTARIAGAVFHLGLGENWGALGPIGVSKSVRGQGLGDALLAASLLGMKAKGVRRCTIDWTTLTDWYGSHGFEKSKEYAAFSLTL